MSTQLEIEHVANLGYGLLGVQSDKDTPVIPGIKFPFYEESLMTDMHPDEDSPIVGQRMKIYQMFPGLRTHEGVLKVLAEPNTAEFWFDMLLKQGTPTGGGPYTHPYTLDVPPSAYTIDLYKARHVQRFWGVEAQSIEPAFDKDKSVFDVDVSARGSFLVRQIKSVATDIIKLDDTYDPNASKGLVVGDLVKLEKADDSASLETSVTAIDSDGVHVTLDDDASAFSEGDFIYLRAQTVDLDTLFPFLWARTEFRFGADAAAALNATQTRIEVGSKWKLTHSFEKKTGSERSGSFDPASFPRTTGEAQLTVKIFFDTLNELNQFLRIASKACVIRMFSGGDKELRITLNKITQKKSKQPLKTGNILYNEIEYEANYNVSDVQGMAVAVINGLSA